MKPRALALCSVGLVALVAVGCSAPVEEPGIGEWRQFRGPDGLGVSASDGLPVSWGEGSSNIRWRVHVPGAGNSSPIVSRGKVFLTTSYGQPEDGVRVSLRKQSPARVVVAYDFESGERLWEAEIFRGPVGRRHWSNTHAAPTPVSDGRNLFVLFDAQLAALDFDGNVLWHHDLDAGYYEYSHYGVSSSPVLAGDAVIVMQDREEGSIADLGWIAAYDKSSGEQIWRDEWDHTCCSYSTPLVRERDGRLEILHQSGTEIVGYDARTGEKLWRGEHPSTQTVPSPLWADDLLVAPGGMHTRALVVFQCCQPDAGPDPVQLWKRHRGVPEIASPVIYNDRLFTVAKNGTMFVWEPRTGKQVWKQRLPPGEYRASLVAGDGKVYALSEEGMTTVIDAAGEKPSILGSNSLGASSGASLALVDDSIVMRTKNELLRIGRNSPELGEPDVPGAPAEAAEEAD